MPARIVMTSGDRFEVDMDIDRVASDILIGGDRHATFEAQEAGTTKRVYVMREHIAYAEAFEVEFT